MSSTIDRKTFVGASVASAAALDAGPAAAQTAPYGKPHPVIVPEDDPTLAIERPPLSSGVGSYVAMPKGARAPAPGLVISTHFWNIDTQIRDVARRFAKLGYMVIVPGLLDRTGVPPGDDSDDVKTYGAAIGAAIAAGHMTDDLRAGHDWLRANTAARKIALMGFCGGGGFALQALAGTNLYAAASIFYGYVRTDRSATQPAPPSTVAWAATVTTPVLGSYGAEDRGINPADVALAYGMMKGPHEYTVYPGAGHAFFDDRRSSYNAAAAEDAYARTVAWFTRYLR